MINRKLKIGIGHPHLGHGGSEARAMWAIEALKDHYDVSLITAGDVELDELKQFYGTSLQLDEFVICYAPMPLFLKRMAGGDALRGAFFQRFFQKIAFEFDVLISTYNLCDFGVPAIHCIADFSWDEKIRINLDPIPEGPRGLFHRNSLLRKAYLRLAKAVSRPSGRNLFAGEDLILANSHWSAGIMREKYGMDIDVLYPPVFAEFPKVPPEEKDMGFVCIGRISPEKRIERVIEILKAVRLRGHDIHLHVIGDTEGTVYGRLVENLCQSEGDWIVMEGGQFGEEKAKLLSQHRFGIHARQGEAFGISVAEMVKAGCITFVPDKGGLSEIVNHPSLTYNSVEDAVDKIDTVLRQTRLQSEMKEYLTMQSKIFSHQRFMSEIKEVVHQFLKGYNKYS